VKKPRGKRKPPAAEREAAAKREAADALIKAPPRKPPFLLRNSITKKWTQAIEVDPADRTPEPLASAMDAVAQAMTTVEHGKNRGASRGEAYNSNATKYEALKRDIIRAKKSHLLASFDSAAIRTQVELWGGLGDDLDDAALDKFVDAFGRYLRGHK
jgi:hypothetical protein